MSLDFPGTTPWDWAELRDHTHQQNRRRLDFEASAAKLAEALALYHERDNVATRMRVEWACEGYHVALCRAREAGVIVDRAAA